MRQISTSRRAAFLLLLALALSPARVPSAQPQAPVAAPRNIYTAGGDVRVTQPVRGDLIAAGGRVLLDQPVGGDVALAGGSVEVRAPVADDLRVAGGAVVVEAQVGGDLFAAGGDVALRPATTVRGTADLNAANLLVQGRIEGELRGRAQKIVVDGEVGGPVHLMAERIELGPRAKLLGPLTYASPAEIQRAEGAIVQGSVTRDASPGGPGRAPAQKGAGGFGVPGIAVAFIALFACSAFLVRLLPGFTHRAAFRLRTSPWASLGAGLATLLALPFVLVLLFITILGIPLGIALMAAYPVLLLAGFGVGVAGAARVLGKRMDKSAQPDQAPVRLRHLALALLLVLLIGLIPAVGPLLVMLLGFAGLGAGALELRARRRGPGAAAAELPLPGHDVFPA